ncbi:protein-export chaperone SecB [Pacificimonas flava]|uniref:Protein-export protein SecB n=2 Tax=Pacificimonas TaxID=1960290 RepID=A0A219B297_9SPHN|nr:MULTISPECIES: protein-export chaperone SecB [Pacificimonas]MBZ6378109.1 protein-export chaperone SecB [Pacificimonas aurantium]OWV32253.1 protein-export chaperone SecB [Pacificimonas flava]
MADEQPQQPEGAAPDQQQPLGIEIMAQYVKDLSFENPNAPESLSQHAGQPAIDIGVSVAVNEKGALSEGAYEVILHLKADAKTDEGQKTAFVIELAYGALFRLQNVPQNLLNFVLLAEAPRLIFPYARRVFADAVRDGGFPPLMLEPIDFMKLAQQQMAQQGGQPENGGGQQGGGSQDGGETPNIILPS